MVKSFPVPSARLHSRNIYSKLSVSEKFSDLKISHDPNSMPFLRGNTEVFHSCKTVHISRARNFSALIKFDIHTCNNLIVTST